MEIAVFVGPNGETAPIQKAGEIQVYHQSCNIWEICRSMPFALQSAKGLPGIREYMKEVLDFLGECRTFVGLSIIGLPYFELEKAGFTIWEMAGPPYSILDSILEAEAASKLDTYPEINIITPRPEPQEIAPGCYSISLKEIQNCNHVVTSKQILFPLLEKTTIKSLEIICSHIPPWLEVKILAGEVNGVIDKISSNETRVTINR